MHAHVTAAAIHPRRPQTAPAKAVAASNSAMMMIGLTSPLNVQLST